MSYAAPTMGETGMGTALEASAPGKLMVSGEYVVLDGAPAIVTAVSRRVRVVLSPGSRDGSPPSTPRSPDAPALPPEVLLTRGLLEQRLGLAPPMHFAFDTSSLRSGATKLGLGSSAALAAATAVVTLAEAERRGIDVDAEGGGLAAALEGHRSIAPDGSGADVLASVRGGFLEVVRREGADPASRPLVAPGEVLFSIVFTGQAARTSTFLATLRARRGDGAVERAMRELGETAAVVASVFGRGGPPLVAAFDRHHDLEVELGDALGLPIVTAELAMIAALARRHGGAAKPSGAGGGDAAIACFLDPAARGRFEEACVEAGLALVDVSLGAPGARVDTQSS